MINRIKNLGKDELIRGSFILFLMMGIFNVLNYIFHFSMARLLGPAGYSVLAVLMSFLYVFGIPAEAIQTIISRYTSKYFVKKNNGKIKSLLSKSLKKAFKLAIFIFLIYIPISIVLSILLDINLWLIVFTGLTIFTFFTIPVTRGILQGKRKFKELGFNLIIESFIKVIFSIAFVLFGLEVFGAIIGVIFGYIATFLMAFLYLKDVLKSKEKKIDTKLIYPYSTSVFFIIVPIVLMYSLDVILARIFFAPDLAGKYAVASTLGKIIFFGTSAIVKTMFPIASDKYERGDESKSIFSKSLKIVLLACIFFIILLALFPKLIVLLLFGSQYVSISNILIYTGLAFSFLSIANLIAAYSLCSNKIVKYRHLMIIFVLIEIILLSLFHENLASFSIALAVSTFLILIATLIFLRDK